MAQRQHRSGGGGGGGGGGTALYRRTRGRRAQAFALVALLVCLLIEPVRAAFFFSFPSKRFRYEGLIDAGALGLDALDGQVVAFGDWNADSAVDLFTLSSDGRQITVYLWDHVNFQFALSPLARIAAPPGTTIVNVVPGDYNYDGKLDVLAMLKRSDSAAAAAAKADELEMVIWLGTQEGSLAPSPLTVNASTDAQPITLDATGSMRADLLGHLPASKDKLSLWRNVLSKENVTGPAFVMQDVPFDATSEAPSCRLAQPHSSAFIDLNGDCIADLFLVCSESSGWRWGSSSSLTYQIWTANKDEKKTTYTLARHGSLPPGTGALSFADMDRDGTIDVVFPSCDGKNGPCYINIAYNRQMPLCSEKRDDWFGVGPGGGAVNGTQRQCRDTESNLCTADDSFSFDFSLDAKNDKMTRIALAALTPDTQLLLTDDLATPAAPLALSLGDFNRDGYPDMAIISIPRDARRAETRLRMLESVSCAGSGLAPPGCPTDAEQRRKYRTFRMLTSDVAAVETMRDVRSVSFMDLDEDGSLDLLVQRLPADGRLRGNARRITFVQNNFFYDAFFLKAMTSNGACSSYCEPSGPGKARYRPWGVNYAGASYKFTVLDPNGIRRPQQVGQLAQTAYRAMLLPYSYFGLGRTNNYVESLFVGVTRRRATNFLEMEGVIPNSQVVILPFEPQQDDGAHGDPSTWKRELYLSPGEWISWVTVVLATIVVMLLGVVFVLHLNEKREDERERKRAVHAINFDAL